jgi:RHS repeat-associated protein
MTWDLNYQLPVLATENGSSGSLIADYQYNPVNQIQSETTGAGTFYYHHDLLGSVTDITDANGALQKSYSYTAFGEVTQTDVATSPPTNRFTYTGEYKEPTTGTAGYYLRSRNYTPETGRFTSRDSYTPGQETPAESSYAYVGNGPTHRYDPQAPVGGSLAAVTRAAGQPKSPALNSSPLSLL